MAAAALAHLLLLAGGVRCVDLLGVSDLHGRLEAIAEIGARAEALRRRGPTLLLDAGDSLQGTLEAYLDQGAPVVEAYGLLGMAATVTGNHDFDYGLEALRRRAAEAPYPFLAANLRDRATGHLPEWKNLHARRLIRLPNGLAVGLLGLAGRDTPWVTMPRNVAGLAFLDPAREAVAQARYLRAEGADLVVALAHVGGRCPGGGPAERDGRACAADGELQRLVRKLPAGTLDALVGGHTHELVADLVEGTAVVQAGAHGAFLSWVTLCEGRPPEVHPPVRVGPGEPFLGAVQPLDPRLAGAVERRLAAARSERERPLGARLRQPLTRSRTAPSSLGAAAAQSLRAAARSDFALVNPGSLRADLPAGEVRAGDLFEALPFDDRLAVLRLTGADLEALLVRLERSGKGFPQVAGLVLGPDGPRTCAGAPLGPRRRYAVATNEFLASGGDQPLPSRLRAGEVELVEGKWIRELLAEWLRKAPAEKVGAGCP